MSRFHPDEMAVQARMGVRERMESAGGRVVRDHMPDQHREFFGELPFFFIGALDGGGQPWATVLAGQPGFLSTPDERTLDIAGATLPGDPLTGQLHAGDYIGGLGLVPATRRRNRVNGLIETVADGGMRVAVLQSFGNCPKYIQARELVAVDGAGDGAEAPRVLRAASLSRQDRELIAAADTFFIASANVDAEAGEGRGVDVSHRGGLPGFVRIDQEDTLTVPDFIGNFFFNTIGNLAGHPRAGLLFIDFDRGDLLHLAVDAQIVWDGAQVQATPGAERLMRFQVREVVRNVAALPLRWSAPQLSPYLEPARFSTAP